jgi:hypothetical protein
VRDHRRRTRAQRSPRPLAHLCRQNIGSATELVKRETGRSGAGRSAMPPSRLG